MRAAEQRRMGDMERDIERLSASNERMHGALAIARFVGFGALVLGAAALAKAIGMV